MYISEIKTTAPESYKKDLQEKVYCFLTEAKIPYERVDTDEIITMEDCQEVDRKLDMDMVKTLFLSDRHHENLFLFITKGDKPFRSGDFSRAVGSSRVSFAPADKMEELLGTKIGAATVFSALLPSSKDVRIVFDEDVLKNKSYGCSDGTTTGYMKIDTHWIRNDLLKYAGRTAEVIQV